MGVVVVAVAVVHWVGLYWVGLVSFCFGVGWFDRINSVVGCRMARCGAFVLRSLWFGIARRSDHASSQRTGVHAPHVLFLFLHSFLNPSRTAFSL